METKFKAWLTDLSEKLVIETYEDIKKNDKFLFAKLSFINFRDANGYNVDQCVKKVKKMNEDQLVEYVNSEILDYAVNSIDDICNLFADDMSDIETFFISYCLYNNKYITDVYLENIKHYNVDGVFEMMSKEDKIAALLEMTDKISGGLSSIYTNKYLIDMWKEFEYVQKLKALKSIYF